MVEPPRRKYIGVWRSPTAPRYPPMRWFGGTAPEISNTQTKSSRPPSRTAFPHRTSWRVVAGSRPMSLHTRSRQQRVEAGPLVDLVEVDDGLPLEQHLPARVAHRGDVGVCSAGPRRGPRPRTVLCSPCWYSAGCRSPSTRSPAAPSPHLEHLGSVSRRGPSRARTACPGRRSHS